MKLQFPKSWLTPLNCLWNRMLLMNWQALCVEWSRRCPKLTGKPCF